MLSSLHVAAIRTTNSIHSYKRTERTARNSQTMNIPQQHPLGKGSFGSVFKIHNHKNEPFALKVIKKDSKQTISDMQREMQVGKHLKHPSIVKVVDTDEDANYWYIFMEYIDGENLFQFVQRTMGENKGNLELPEAVVKNIFKKLVKGVCYAHRHGVAHMDLKLENVMLSKKNVKIIDFGLCTDRDIYGYHTRFVGSPDYSAPEILHKKAYRPSQADVWSLGTILFVLLTGEMPFSRSERRQVEKGAVHPQLEWRDERRIPKKAKDLVEKMLKIDPDYRITMEQVSKHPWIRWSL